MIRRLHESYSDINSENVWEALDIAAEYLGDAGLWDAIARAMGTDALADVLKHIFQYNEIPFMEEEEYFEDDEDFDDEF